MDTQGSHLPAKQVEIRIVKFVRDDHFDAVSGWLSARNMSNAVLDELPEIGLIAFEQDMPICCGFLRQIEGNLGLFDGLCSNPGIDKARRHLALDFLVQEIVLIAKEFKMRSIFAWTSDAGTLVRAERHYFQKLDHRMITLDLNQDLGVH